MSRPNAGPVGAGLIPPSVSGPPAPPASPQDDDDRDDDQHRDDDQQAPPPPDDVDIDGVPPVQDEADDDDDDDDQDGSQDGSPDVAEIERRLEAKFQKRFDKAISKITRKLEQTRPDPHGSTDEDDDDEDDDGPPAPKAKPRRSTQQRQRQVDVTSIRLLARDQIADEMERTGKAERAAVKKVIDKIVPHVDWSQVDADDFVDDLVSTLSSTAQELVKTGSDRKVAQLRSLGHLPERAGQPGSGVSRIGGRPGGSPGSAMQKGAARAAERFPNGQRRLGR